MKKKMLQDGRYLWKFLLPLSQFFFTEAALIIRWHPFSMRILIYVSMISPFLLWCCGCLQSTFIRLQHWTKSLLSRLEKFMVIIYVDIGFLLIMLLAFVAGLYSIVRHILDIIWNISTIFFLLGALVSLFTHIFLPACEDSNSKMASVFYILSGIVRTFFLGIGWEIIYEAFCLGRGEGRVKDYILLGEISMDSRLLSLIIMVVSIAITDVIHYLSYGRKKSSDRILMCSVNMFLLLLVLVGTTYIGLKSNVKNSLDIFNYESPEYVLTKSSDMYQYVVFDDSDSYSSWWYPFGSPISTGKFKKGAEVYACGEEYSEYILVTDKTRVGYVEKDALKNLVYYTYYIKKGTKVYADQSACHIENSTAAVVARAKKKTKVELLEETDIRYFMSKRDSKYERSIKVKLKSGKEGFVKESSIQVVRKKKLER